MGISIESFKFLTAARRAGVDFTETLTLGRQYVTASPRQIIEVLRLYQIWPPPGGEKNFLEALEKTQWRFDAMAQALGARRVVSCDISSYEGAGMVHDMNHPIEKKDEERFDTVIDGGTLEHVFNFPVAIENAMRLTKVGGTLILFTPANNYFGHGFYQFSPELIYRVLSPENGFKIHRMVATVEDIAESGSLLGIRYPFQVNGPWYDVADPIEVHSRVTLMNEFPVGLMVLAERTSREEIFKRTPQQSDYVPQWNQLSAEIPHPKLETTASQKIIRWIRNHLPETVWREFLPKIALFVDPFRVARYRRERSFSNRSFFKRL
jgi:SAM-dependent methyltransferase